MTSATVSSGAAHSAPLGLMSCVRESSPQDLVPHSELELDRNESSKKRRFHPFRGLRKMFRRGKVRTAGSEETVPTESGGSGHEDSASAKDSQRSRSASELLAPDEPTRRKSGGGGAGGGGGVVGVGGLFSGGGALSVSHDSVFTAEQHSTSSDLDTAQSSSSLSIQQLMQHSGVRAELIDVVRRRGRERADTSEDDEDLGLPRSPCNSPTVTDTAIKDQHQSKSHSTCSDGSLLSMGSSEMDEESFGQHSRHSSKLSLHDRRPSQAADTELELGSTSVTAPLSHSAARHKMAVRPKRTHGAPRRRRVQQLTASSALPTTPEVNEDVSTRSLTPESSTTRETIAELYSSSSTSMAKVWNASSSVATETQLKSASLPPGLALPTGAHKLSRSRSNAGTRGARDTFLEEEESDDKSSKEDKKKEESFFGRFLSRRSAKKKKSKSEEMDAVISTSSVVEKSETVAESISSYRHTEEKRTYSVDSGISKVIRSGPASRQRVQPIDIPASPDAYRHKRQQHIDLDLPMPPSTSSPEPSPPKKRQGYLSKQTKVMPICSTSPDKTANEPVPDVAPVPSPRTQFPQSPPKPSWLENLPPLKPVSSVYTDTKLTENSSRSEECKTKVKITGLSSYQQRVITYNDDVDSPDLKSLDETSEDGSLTKMSVSKSHSFRSKSVLSSTQDHSSLPFLVNSSNFDNSSDSETFTDSLVSTSNTYSSATQSTSDHVSVTVKDTENQSEHSVENTGIISDDEVKVISTNIDPPQIDKPADIIKNSTEKSVKTNSCEQINNVTHEKVNLLEERLENKADGITISCVNSQMQASVNTHSSNQVIVSISNTAGSVSNMHEHTSSSNTITTKSFSETSVRETTSQVSVTKVQLKRESKPIDSTQVPEFLKIQLNKVDVKPTTNVVLSTTNSFSSADEKLNHKHSVEIETDRDSGETTVEHLKQRKFSKEDVEIIDKDMDEEIVEVPSKNISITSLQTNIKSSSEHVKKQLPTLILNNANNVQPRKSSVTSISPVSPTSAKPFLKKKSNSIELGDSIKKSDEKLLSENPNKLVTNSSDQLSNSKTEFGKEKTACTSDEPMPDVILRKKSLVSQKRDKDGDEPELMKVFARRSLKLKDSEAEALGQQVLVMVENSDNQKSNLSDSTKRDSDKENDGGESPPEERKRNSLSTSKETPKQKEPLTESKYVETADVTLRKPTATVNNKLASFGQKFQRAVTISSPVSSEVNDNTVDGDKRKNKSYIEQKTDKKPIINNYRSHIMSIREKDIENKKSTEITKTKTSDDIITHVPLKKDFENEDFVPLFKKIQQRKEEWEQRAQQNMKKSVP